MRLFFSYKGEQLVHLYNFYPFGCALRGLRGRRQSSVIGIDPVDHGLMVDAEESTDAPEAQPIHVHFEGHVPLFLIVALFLRVGIVDFLAGMAAVFLAATHGFAVLGLTKRRVAQRTRR